MSQKRCSKTGAPTSSKEWSVSFLDALKGKGHRITLVYVTI